MLGIPLPAVVGVLAVAVAFLGYAVLFLARKVDEVDARSGLNGSKVDVLAGKAEAEQRARRAGEFKHY
jgi:hypothetical protein